MRHFVNSILNNARGPIINHHRTRKFPDSMRIHGHRERGDSQMKSKFVYSPSLLFGRFARMAVPSHRRCSALPRETPSHIAEHNSSPLHPQSHFFGGGERSKKENNLAFLCASTMSIVLIPSCSQLPGCGLRCTMRAFCFCETCLSHADQGKEEGKTKIITTITIILVPDECLLHGERQRSSQSKSLQGPDGEAQAWQRQIRRVSS